MRKLGAILVDGVTLPDVSESWFAEHLEVMFTEFKAQLPQYLAARRPRATVRTLADVIEVYPALTLPMGSVNGLPVGILIFGTAWSDAVLLRCAYAYEQATHHRKPPPPRV